MPKLIDVTSEADILPAYRGTPVADLLRYHCLKAPQPPRTARPQMLIAMCIDHRKSLTIPNEFAYVIRAAGTRLLGNEFELTYAIGVGGVDTIALIGHTQCGMTRVLTQREQFIEGLVERGGISREAAAEHYDASAPGYAIALLVSDYALWTFTRLEGASLHERAMMTVVLAFPGALGAATARLVI